jgi:hypothetical protein
MKLLDNFSYPILIGFAVLLGLAPFRPEPHLVEKLGMLFQGTLSRPLDIFDLVMHSTPFILIILKFILDKKKLKST